MRAGARRHAIVLERPSEKVVAGANKTGWTKVAETRATIVALTGRELVAAQQVHAEVTTKINIRYRPGVDETLRARDVRDGTLFGILAVIPDPTLRREIDLYCVKRTSEGWRDGADGG